MARNKIGKTVKTEDIADSLTINTYKTEMTLQDGGHWCKAVLLNPLWDCGLVNYFSIRREPSPNKCQAWQLRTTGVRCSTINSRGVPTTTGGTVGKAVVVVGTVSVVQSLSSSGQSSTPSHQDVALMQMLLVGHRSVPEGQGLQMHPHEGVSSLCRPYNQNILVHLFTSY
jgi:hypothetical protein